MSTLFEPVRFRGGATARNRLALAALTNQQSHLDGTLSDDEARWLEARATGGFGIVTSCATYVSQEGKTWRGELGLATAEHADALRPLAGRIRAAGALGMVQLFHGGLRASAQVSGVEPLSASAHEGGAWRGATTAELERIIDDFRRAALAAHAIGMAGVELHGAHGYLLAQFLSRTENQRTDAWGGSLENRARLLREVAKAVRGAVPSEFVVGVRLSPEDFRQSRGIDLDETVQVARWMADDGLDFVHASLWDVTRNTQKYPEQHALPMFRAALPVEVPLFTAGKIWTRAEAEATLERGADVIALGRAAIMNPDWPRAAQDPAWQPRTPPMSSQDLHARAVSPTFVAYLRAGWPGFVAD